MFTWAKFATALVQLGLALMEARRNAGLVQQGEDAVLDALLKEGSRRVQKSYEDRNAAAAIIDNGGLRNPDEFGG